MAHIFVKDWLHYRQINQMFKDNKKKNGFGYIKLRFELELLNNKV